MFIVSDRSKELVQKIAERFGTREEALRDPGFCLESMLEAIEKRLDDNAKRGGESPLRTTLDRGISKNALAYRRRELLEKV